MSKRKFVKPAGIAAGTFLVFLFTVSFLTASFSVQKAYAGEPILPAITIVNETDPPFSIENIEYSGAGASAYPMDCPFANGGTVLLNHGEGVMCDGLTPGNTYAIIELNGPYTAEYECNLPVTPQVPGVISFTRTMGPTDHLICTITNTPLPFTISHVVPGFAGPAGPPNMIFFENGPPNGNVSFYYSFLRGGTGFFPPPCDSTPFLPVDLILLGSAVADPFGDGVFEFNVPMEVIGWNVGWVGLNEDNCVPSNGFIQKIAGGEGGGRPNP